ncbi:TetR family transcriptional regulator [Asanoa ishikariensis]|uniref:Transcriptional regulator, TetR family n=1 Tax=Asanoa ishikariensis TaxID=137265 RepID=A0A1H3UAX7_9ACTN|nr:TetR/AcrR family transcriptional regulator [Asanoa ishikariensis]GIF63936.1 TetR family transcriptional regulator [Asanoa ishikariensis]SDZ59582.1 transcriptional regulator, TetR family [Asanoa ishikariensis]
MGRVSQAEARANRAAAVQAATRLFRESGVANVGVADVMKSVGLTPGGFYKRFPSKAALVDEAVGMGFTDMLRYLSELSEDTDDHAAAWQALLDTYLSVQHRDDPGEGCPAAGFAGDIARDPAPRQTYATGVREMAAWIAPGDAGLAALATLVGGVLLARATAGSPVSEEILRAVSDAASPLPE